MKHPSKFWDRHAEGYAKHPVGDEAAYQKKLEITQGYLKPDMKLLEFGCGTGSTAILHAPHVSHIHAIDISPKIIEIAERKTAAANIGNITYQTATIEEFDAPEESFHMILGLSILHLLEDKEAAIAKVRRLLKPGGLFVTSTVCLGETMKFFKYVGPIGKFFGLLPLIQVFSAQELADSFTDGGFEIDHQWQPAKGKAAFTVAKKPGAQ